MSSDKRLNRLYLRKLSQPATAGALAGLESSESAPLSAERVERAYDTALRIIDSQNKGSVDQQTRAEADTLFLSLGKEAAERLRGDGEDATLDDGHFEALEAIVEVDGSRPCPRIGQDDRIDPSDELLGIWRLPATEYESQIASVARAVGRVDRDGSHQGTGFVIAEDLILTNRHVLQGLAQHGADGTWDFTGTPSITFDADPGETRERHFEIETEVVCAGAEQIDMHAPVDLTKHDLAVLRCKIKPGTRLPDPLILENDASKVVESRPVYTIGYPGAPPTGLYKFSILQKLFGSIFSVKRFAPGEIDERSADGSTTVFAHDCTTLGGNSGSCVVDLGDDGQLVVGLHFAGKAKSRNLAHVPAKVRNELAGFKSLSLTWKDRLPPG